MSAAQKPRQKLISLQRILLSWSVIALGVAALLLSYFLYQASTQQFSSSWSNKLEAELGGLRLTLQHQLAEEEWSLSDQTLSRMATRPHVHHLLLWVDGKVKLSTRRADIGQPLTVDLTALHLSLDTRQVQYFQAGGEFYSLQPLQYRTRELRGEQEAWLFAHYDARSQYQQMLQSTGLRIALLVLLLVLYTLGLQRILQRQVLRPLYRLVKFTLTLQAGKLGQTIHSGTSSEFAHLERAFNNLSQHLQHSMQQIREQHMRDQAFTRAFPDVAFLLDNDGIIRGRYGSLDSPLPALHKDLTGQPFTCWLQPHAAGRMTESRDQALLSLDMEITEFRHEDFYIESRMTPLLDKSQTGQPQVNGLLWLIRDISEVKRKQQQIEYQANFDSLTRLANRRFALLHIEKKMAHARRVGKFGAVLFIDLDHFKNINDSLGHPVGDKLLVKMGERLNQLVRDEDLTARLGGDEFLVLFDELGDTPEAAAQYGSDCAERLLAAIREPFNIDIHCFHLSASIGIAVFPAHQDEATDLVRQSDTAMYHAKAQGRSGISIYTQNMQQETQDKLNLYNDLHQAIEQQAFTLVFQPQINEQTEITGAEVLCRWTNRGVPVSPEVFIRAAEETRLILPLGQWILSESCRVLKRWRQQNVLPESFRRLAVNISPAQFMDENFERYVTDQVSGNDLCSAQLELEITESIFLGNKDTIRSKMQRLSSMGFTFALDDFGTGYSSLSYLQHLPLHKLKIDRSFVMDIEDNTRPARIVDSIIQMGQNLGMDIIAEGVEHQAQRDYLQNHGCCEFQGYLFSRPLAEDEFLEFVRHNSALAHH
ncbi:EAL domain-containing protein [Thalassolituus pacificus]|uniref:EAL domain-containing protein n=1 Tax=Thalassolituus pacificus TaxID=2975440 RepID=A0A9X3ARS8_9GAMM|nr:EAL domain-containing protein [Thalassolituus pacificus]MCT7359149.1 EAL domain-containing protein [Thalassolituus pacificus]